MVKRALCVGINDYPYEGNDLRGCVNDARAWAALLTKHFAFATPDMRLLTDAEATKANIIGGLKDILTGAKAGDVLIFAMSSHGSQLVDTSGDEGDVYDELICPYDSEDASIIDDELRELFSTLPPKVQMVALLDTCFSGTGTRAALDMPTDARARFLNPRLLNNPVLGDQSKARPRSMGKHPESGMHEIILSGCANEESAWDASFDGWYHGVMTYHAIRAIQAANYIITYDQLHHRLGSLIDVAVYPQHPQLEGRTTNKRRQVFV